MASILLVSEDAALRQLADVILTRGGHELITVGRPEEGVRARFSVKVDALLFDCGALGRLEELAGLLDWLTASNESLAAIVITALPEPLPISSGISCRVLAKPVAAHDLEVAVSEALNEPPPGHSDIPIDSVGLKLDVDRQQLKMRGRKVALSTREFELARYFVERPSEVVTFRDVLEDVWCLPLDDSSLSTLRSHVHNLRRKFDEVGAEGGMLRTLKGRGYRLL
jgi:DNA-binding response OmpR family regulator